METDPAQTERSLPTRRGLIEPSDFGVCCQQYRIRFTRAVELPSYKGDALHRLFGKGLERIGERHGRYFYHPAAPPDWPGQSPPKPFMLIPPPEETRRYEKGDETAFGLILYGEAQQHFLTAWSALEAAGNHTDGNGLNGRYRITEVSQITLCGRHTLYTDGRWQAFPNPIQARRIFETVPADADAVTLQLITPLRLKHQGRLVRQPPPLAVLIERLLGRINTLAALYCGGPMLMPEDKIMLGALAKTATVVQAGSLRWQEWRRGPRETYGGLLGAIGYADVAPELLPWLALGQWTGVGGKTSFGLGHYKLETDG